MTFVIIKSIFYWVNLSILIFLCRNQKLSKSTRVIVAIILFLRWRFLYFSWFLFWERLTESTLRFVLIRNKNTVLFTTYATRSNLRPGFLGWPIDPSLIFNANLTLIGKSWKTHPEIFLKFSFSGSSHILLENSSIRIFWLKPNII